jgi:hypothetical protein
LIERNFPEPSGLCGLFFGGRTRLLTLRKTPTAWSRPSGAWQTAPILLKTACIDTSDPVRRSMRHEKWASCAAFDYIAVMMLEAIWRVSHLNAAGMDRCLEA